MDRFYAVTAAASGIVVELSINSFDRNTGLGTGTPSNTVLIRHSDGTYAYYYHLMKRSATVKLGEYVLQGQTIGYVGSSGNSTDAHLHFEPGYFTNNTSSGVYYYLVIRHRNSIETWIKTVQQFSLGYPVSYDFTTSKTKAYGDNLKLKNGEYCFYSGDVNQNGIIDLADVLIVHNAAQQLFQSTYAVTDTDGDGYTDLSDVLITYNNSTNFIVKIRP